MDFDFTEEQENFRKEVRAWLERNLPDDLKGKSFAASRADKDEVTRLRWWQTLGGWPTFALPLPRLPHASRCSKRGHHGPRGHVHTSQTSG